MYKVFEKVSEGLGEVNQKFDNDELKYLQEALRLVDYLSCQEGREAFEFVTAENSPSP